MLRQNLREAFANLKGSKQRTALALIGIVIGTASVIAMINIATIVKAEALSRFKEMGTDILTIQLRGGGRSGPKIQPEDTTGLVREVPAIVAVAPLVSGGAQLSFQGRPGNATLLASDSSLTDLAKLHVASGRFVSRLDGYQPYCVIGADIQTAFGHDKPGPELGDALRIGEYVYTIAGILAPAAQNPMVP